MLKKILAIATLVSIVLLGGLLLSTNPSTAGPLGILIFFVLMYLSVLGALTFLFYGVSRTISKMAIVRQRRLGGVGVTFRKSYYYASVAALGPIMLVAMQSVSRIGFYQFLLVVFFVTIAWIYISKRTT